MTLERNEVFREIGRLQQRIDELRAQMTRDIVLEELSGRVSMVLCRAGDSYFGFLLENVEETILFCKLQAMPESQPWQLGLLNLRGILVPVIDLLGRISRSYREPRINDFIMVCNLRGKRFGVVVQDVLNVTDVDAASVESVSESLQQAPYLLGVARINSEPVFILSLSCLTAASEFQPES